MMGKCTWCTWCSRRTNFAIGAWETILAVAAWSSIRRVGSSRSLRPLVTCRSNSAMIARNAVTTGGALLSLDALLSGITISTECAVDPMVSVGAWDA